MIRKKMHILAAALLAAIAASAAAQNVPPYTGYVNDYAAILTAADKTDLERYLSALDAATGIQIAVLTIPSLDGQNIEEYAFHVAEAWRPGQKEKDNGAMLVVAVEERKIRIETGYGLEGTLTDTKCGLIIRNVIVPEFRNGNYSAGIVAGVRNMAGIASGDEALVAEGVANPEKADAWSSVAFGFLFVFGWFILFSCLASGRQNHWLPWIIFTRSYRNSHRFTGGGANNPPSGGFRGGSRPGGGFRGGGGRFGGGGASGGW